jgi:hypothetical protein
VSSATIFFCEAAGKFLAENNHKRSLERDRRAVAIFEPSPDEVYFGELAASTRAAA